MTEAVSMNMNGSNSNNNSMNSTATNTIAGDSKDSVSVNSHQTGTTQTRFSFYNAQDFVQPNAPRSSSVGAGHQSPSKNDTRASAAAAPPQTPLGNRDSVEILKSLQEHEQQRLEILGANGLGRDRSGGGTGGDAVTRKTESSFRLDLAAGASSTDVSNPYEDAIKEALDLLRKHRSPREPFVPMSQPPTPAVSSVVLSSLSPARTPSGTRYSTQQYAMPEACDIGSRTPPDVDRILQLREEVSEDSNAQESDYDGGGGYSGGPRAMHQQDQGFSATITTTTPSAAVALGEAYQAEIEARRKQRQERMARYATRLAELKQEDRHHPAPHHGEAMENNFENFNSRRRGGKFSSSNSDAGPNWGGPPRLESVTSSWHSSITDAPTSRSVPSDFPNLPTYRAVESSSSALSDFATTSVPQQVVPISNEDEVHRGVERVLLAILERANSQGRAGRAQTSETQQQLQRPDTERHSRWPISTSREEKKAASPEESRPSPTQEGVDDDGAASDNCNNEDNALVRAMTDLLGAPSTSSLGSSSPNLNALKENTEHCSSQDQQLLEIHLDHENLTQSQSLATAASVGPSPSNSYRKTTLTIDTSFRGTPQHVTTQRDVTPEDDLDKIVRTVYIQDTSEIKARKGDLIDQRVRSVLSPDPDKQRIVEQQQQQDEEEDDDEEEESGDNGQENFSREDSDDWIEDEEEDDDEDDEAFVEDEDNMNSNSELEGVLGPLSKSADDTTGIVLEGSSHDQRDSLASPSFLDSLSAAVSIVTGALTDETDDKYSMNEIDDETEELMKTLCAHLLEAHNNNAPLPKLKDKRPGWDESNPDEAGYRIIRLTTVQLAAVEFAFERMIANVKQKEEKDRSDRDEAFERDLKEAEDLLDAQEKASKQSIETGSSNLDSESATRQRIYSIDQPLPCFPGVKSTGRGEMGDLEYFHLPIIYKSHVTGFEPTKDLVLEAGNVVAGQYLVEGELGSAAFSTAYRCVDLSSDGERPDGHDEVCLKVIKNTKDFFDQSLDEIKILELLRQTGMCHEKHIVEMKTFFYHREHLVIVTELLRQNLFEFGKFIVDSNEEPYFTLPRLCYLTRQILVALDFVHTLGLVHSDVKPENILLSSYSRAQVKVIDFGSSCFMTDRQSSYIQSRSYRAPEVILGLPYDGRIDIWSLGCVVAEMYTGEVTFQNDSIVSMLSRIEAICGTFPSHMIAQGRQSGRFFTKCGLLFEKLPTGEPTDSQSDESEEEDDGSSDTRKRFIDVFQPKVTSLSERLGFSPLLMHKYRSNVKLSREERHQAVFVDFIQQLLTINPDKRPSAAGALEHPWMKYAESLTEEDIKYPSS